MKDGVDGSTSTVPITDAYAAGEEPRRDLNCLFQKTETNSTPKVLKQRRGSAVEEACTLFHRTDVGLSFLRDALFHTCYR